MNPCRPIIKCMQIRIRSTTAHKEDMSSASVIKRIDGVQRGRCGRREGVAEGRRENGGGGRTETKGGGREWGDGGRG